MAKYIDNAWFMKVLTEYLVSCEAAQEAGEELPLVPHDVGESFIKIATGLGNSYRFSKYTYLDDMIGDAVEACFNKVRNFNFRQYSNPFSYFTQICWYSFIGSTGEEYKQKKIIYRVCERLSLEEFKVDADDVDTKNQYLEFLRENIDQREFDRIQQQEGERKFVHRMITQPVKKAVVVPATAALSFD